MLDSCPEHGFSPPRGPGGSSAKALCPHCTIWGDLKAGRVHLGPDDQPREGSPKSKAPGVRRQFHHGLVSDGPAVSTRSATPYMTELWAAHLARQGDARRDEEAALARIEENRRRRERQNNPREPRLQSQKYEDGKWHLFYAPERRRDPFIFETFEDGDGDLLTWQP